MADEKTVETQNNAQVRATVENKAPKPAGLLPKNTQQLVILGVAVVMVLIMWMTSGNKLEPTPRTASGTARVQPPNPSAVEDFKQTIQQEQAATRQPISPSNLARLQALALAGDVPPVTTVPPPEGAVPEPGGVIGGPPGGAPPPPPDPVKEDKKKREDLSLFATNVAFTARKSQAPEQLVGSRQPTALSTQTTSQMPPNTGELDAQVRQPEAQLLAPGQAAEREARGIRPPQAEANKPQPT